MHETARLSRITSVLFTLFIAAPASAADLVVEHFEPNPEVPGAFRIEVCNRGPTRSWGTELYIDTSTVGYPTSAGAPPSPPPQPLAMWFVPELDPDACVEGSGSPRDFYWPSPSQFVEPLAIVDPLHFVPETDEANNITPGPRMSQRFEDWWADLSDAPSVLGWGTKVAVKVCGGIDSVPVGVELHLAAGPTLDRTTDISLGIRSVVMPPPSGPERLTCETVEFEVAAPSPNHRFLIAVVDPLDEHSEAIEANSAVAGPVILDSEPNLSIRRFEIDMDQAPPQASIEVCETSGHFRPGSRLDLVLFEDTPAGTLAASFPLGQGITEGCEVVVTPIQQRAHQVAAVIRSPDDALDRDNLRTLPFLPSGLDLAIEALRQDYQGRVVTLEADICNRGSVDAPATDIQFLTLEGDNYDFSSNVGTSPVPATAAGECVTAILVPPRGLPPAPRMSYGYNTLTNRVGAVLDPADRLAEVDETNNRRSIRPTEVVALEFRDISTRRLDMFRRRVEYTVCGPDTPWDHHIHAFAAPEDAPAIDVPNHHIGSSWSPGYNQAPRNRCERQRRDLEMSRRQSGWPASEETLRLFLGEYTDLVELMSIPVQREGLRLERVDQHTKPRSDGSTVHQIEVEVCNDGEVPALSESVDVYWAQLPRPDWLTLQNFDRSSALVARLHLARLPLEPGGCAIGTAEVPSFPALPGAPSTARLVAVLQPPTPDSGALGLDRFIASSEPIAVARPDIRVVEGDFIADASRWAFELKATICNDGDTADWPAVEFFLTESESPDLSMVTPVVTLRSNGLEAGTCQELSSFIAPPSLASGAEVGHWHVRALSPADAQPENNVQWVATSVIGNGPNLQARQLVRSGDGYLEPLWAELQVCNTGGVDAAGFGVEWTYSPEPARGPTTFLSPPVPGLRAGGCTWVRYRPTFPRLEPGDGFGPRLIAEIVPSGPDVSSADDSASLMLPSMYPEFAEVVGPVLLRWNYWSWIHFEAELEGRIDHVTVSEERGSAASSTGFLNLGYGGWYSFEGAGHRWGGSHEMPFGTYLGYFDPGLPNLAVRDVRIAASGTTREFEVDVCNFSSTLARAWTVDLVATPHDAPATEPSISAHNVPIGTASGPLLHPESCETLRFPGGPLPLLPARHWGPGAYPNLESARLRARVRLDDGSDDGFTPDDTRVGPSVLLGTQMDLTVEEAYVRLTTTGQPELVAEVCNVGFADAPQVELWWVYSSDARVERPSWLPPVDDPVVAHLGSGALAAGTCRTLSTSPTGAVTPQPTSPQPTLAAIVGLSVGWQDPNPANDQRSFPSPANFDFRPGTPYIGTITSTQTEWGDTLVEVEACNTSRADPLQMYWSAHPEPTEIEFDQSWSSAAEGCVIRTELSPPHYMPSSAPLLPYLHVRAGRTGPVRTVTLP